MWLKIEDNQYMLVNGKRYLVVDCDFKEETIITYDEDEAPELGFIDNDCKYYSDGSGLFEYMIPIEELTSDKSLNYNNPVLANTNTDCFSCKNYSPK